MKYIGPFLKINTLNKNNIKCQLFHLSKESVNEIILKSKCGITIPVDELKIKNNHLNISTFKSFSPLLCIYKKASCKLVTQSDNSEWNEEKFKKQFKIKANAYMTLSVLEMADYYYRFKGKDESEYNKGKLYMSLARKQLEFFTSNLRNEEGLFVDKNDISDSEGMKFEDINKKFNFSNQSLLMTAYYRYYTLYNGEDKDSFKNFSMDIFKMLEDYKEDIYNTSFDDLMNVCLSLNLFYRYSKEEKVLNMLLDLSDLLFEQYKNSYALNSQNKLEYECCMFLNSILLYKNTGIVKFKEYLNSIHNKLIELYSPELGIFIKKSDKKEIDFSCDEITLYLMSMLLYSDMNKNTDTEIISDIFKHQIVNSGIILSWPDVPPLNSIERYRNYSKDAKDLLSDNFFRLPSIDTPESSEYAPVFVKNISYNRKKQCFKHKKNTFDSDKNMFIFFYMIYFFKSINTIL